MKSKNYTWMQMHFDEGMMLKIDRLEGIHFRAVTIWLKALMVIMNQKGESWSMQEKLLMPYFVNKHTSRAVVKEVLLASGDFVYEEGTKSFYIVPSSLNTLLGISVQPQASEPSAEMPVVTPSPSANLPVVEPPLAHARGNNKLKLKQKLKINIKQKQKETAAVGAAAVDADAGIEEKADAGNDEKMIGLLTEGPRNQHWREVCKMNHPELREELEQDMPWAIRRFFDWAIARGEDQVLWNEKEAKRYFNNFCSNTKTSDRLKQEFKVHQIELERLNEARRKEEQFQEAMRKRFPRVAAMDAPLSFEQYRELAGLYSEGAVLETLGELDTRSELRARAPAVRLAVCDLLEEKTTQRRPPKTRTLPAPLKGG